VTLQIQTAPCIVRQLAAGNIHPHGETLHCVLCEIITIIRYDGNKKNKKIFDSVLVRVGLSTSFVRGGLLPVGLFSPLDNSRGSCRWVCIIRGFNLWIFRGGLAVGLFNLWIIRMGLIAGGSVSSVGLIHRLIAWVTLFWLMDCSRGSV
jgi:hypothetical protein